MTFAVIDSFANHFAILKTTDADIEENVTYGHAKKNGTYIRSELSHSLTTKSTVTDAQMLAGAGIAYWDHNEMATG